jgi:hypothetical protein
MSMNWSWRVLEHVRKLTKREIQDQHYHYGGPIGKCDVPEAPWPDCKGTGKCWTLFVAHRRRIDACEAGPVQKRRQFVDARARGQRKQNQWHPGVGGNSGNVYITN